MSRRGRPATGRQRSSKLHLWIRPEVGTKLDMFCTLREVDKVSVVERAVDRYIDLCLVDGGIL